MNPRERMRLDFIGNENLRYSIKVDQMFDCRQSFSLLVLLRPDQWLKRMRSCESHCVISERITWSPTASPPSTSIVLTDARPNLTVARVPYF